MFKERAYRRYRRWQKIIAIPTNSLLSLSRAIGKNTQQSSAVLMKRHDVQAGMILCAVSVPGSEMQAKTYPENSAVWQHSVARAIEDFKALFADGEVSS